MTAVSTSSDAFGAKTPTDLTIKPPLAVNSLPGRAKLGTSRPPEEKSAATSGTARGSP